MSNVGSDADQRRQDKREAAGFAQTYPGIEGFYLVNGKAQLGYVRKSDGVPIRETFDRPRLPGLSDAVEVSFEAHLEAFTNAVTYLLEIYRKTPLWRSIELGYVRSEGATHVMWRSATLVVHHEVVSRFRAHEDAQIRAGLIDPFQEAETSESLHAERSIHHGMDDLLHLSDEFGRYVYMPMLFYRGSEQTTSGANEFTDGSRQSELVVPTSAGYKEPLRVLNLIWRPMATEQALPDGSRIDIGRLLDPFNPVLDLLRSNLIGRGAIDRARRVENRFSIT